jgi:hypothetical protein
MPFPSIPQPHSDLGSVMMSEGFVRRIGDSYVQ